VALNIWPKWVKLPNGHNRMVENMCEIPNRTNEIEEALRWTKSQFDIRVEEYITGSYRVTIKPIKDGDKNPIFFSGTLVSDIFENFDEIGKWNVNGLKVPKKGVIVFSINDMRKYD
jgi:hypothetical protein